MGSDIISIGKHCWSPLGESFIVLVGLGLYRTWKWMLSFLFEWSLLRLLTKLTGHFSSRLELASLSAVAGEHIGSDFEAENFLSAPYRSYFFKAVKSRTILQLLMSFMAVIIRGLSLWTAQLLLLCSLIYSGMFEHPLYAGQHAGYWRFSSGV